MSTDDLGPTGPSERDRAAWQLRDHIAATAIAVFGAEPTATPSSDHGSILDDPLAGVRAARFLGDVAMGQLRRWALRARGAGQGWDDVADALELPERDGEGAWEWLVEHRPPAPEPGTGCSTSVVWTCTTCQQRVRDSGPFASHPDDRESGHDASCARHVAALDAWRREGDLDETETDR